jgi:hypothetical protein
VRRRAVREASRGDPEPILLGRKRARSGRVAGLLERSRGRDAVRPRGLVAGSRARDRRSLPTHRRDSALRRFDGSVRVTKR